MLPWRCMFEIDFCLNNWYTIQIDMITHWKFDELISNVELELDRQVTTVLYDVLPEVMMKLEIGCWASRLIHCSNDVWTENNICLLNHMVLQLLPKGTFYNTGNINWLNVYFYYLYCIQVCKQSSHMSSLRTLAFICFILANCSPIYASCHTGAVSTNIALAFLA